MFAVNWPPHAPAPGTRLVFDAQQIGVRHASGRVRAHRLEDILNGDVLAVKLARRNRAAVEHHAGNIETRERHDGAGNRLVAARQRDEAVEQVAARDELDGVGNQIAADERRLHPLAAHRDAVGDRHGVELHRRAAGLANAFLDVLGERAQVVVARTDFDPGVRDADNRLAQIGIGEADRLQHRARRRAARAVGDGAAAGFHGIAQFFSFHDEYEPSVRIDFANSAR